GDELAPRPQSLSQVLMTPIWPCWVIAMSPPSVRTSGRVAFWYAIMPISTAWAWWVDMSRAKPASAESSPGVPGRVSRPAPYPIAIRRTAAMAPAIRRARGGERTIYVGALGGRHRRHGHRGRGPPPAPPPPPPPPLPPPLPP